jgi:hypothetical protein
MSTLISSIVTESHTESEALGGKKRSIMIPKQPLDVRDGIHNIRLGWLALLVENTVTPQETLCMTGA